MPFEKAKLWKNLGHIKTHLGGGGYWKPKYPATAQIVEIEVQYTLTPMVRDAMPLTPALLIAENNRKRAEREAVQKRIDAVRRLEQAEKDLVAAHKKIEQLTRR